MSDVPVSAPSSAPSAPSSSPAPAAPSQAAPAAAPKAASEGAKTLTVPGAATAAPEGTAKTETPAEQVAKEIRKLKGKVNGKEVEWSEEEAIRRLQMESSADERFKQASELRKQAEDFFNTLLADPKSVLMHPDVAKRINFRALAEEFLSGELQREMMTPEQRELAELRSFRQQQEEQQKRTQQEQTTRAQQEQMQRLQAQAAQEYDTEISKVLEASNLPKTPYAVKRVAEIMLNALQKGYEVDAATAVDMVRRGYSTDIQSLVGGLDGEHLIKVLGDDIAKKIRKHDLAALKSKLATEQPAAIADKKPSPAKAREDQQQRLTPDQWREMIFKKAGV